MSGWPLALPAASRETMIDPVSFLVGALLAIPTWELVVEPYVIPRVAHRLRGLAVRRHRAGRVRR